MKTIRMITALLMLIPAMVFTSCIRDEIEDCPPLQITLAVKDKNYFNVDDVALEERKADDLPFREYVPTIYYILRDAATGEVVEESDLIEVKGDGQVLTLDLCPCIPHGRYELTVWGGMRDLEALSDDGQSIGLVHEGKAGDDVYVASGTVVYDAWNNNPTLEMERTKGKLIVEMMWANPASWIDASLHSVTGLYAGVDKALGYTGGAKASAEHRWTPGEHAVTKTILAPSVKENGSVLSLDLFSSANLPGEVPEVEDVPVTMKRNELTVLRYVWEQDFTIYLLVNDRWQIVYQMEVE